MWTLDSTEGFTQDHLDIINEVIAEMVADGIEESNANDLVTNAWVEGIETADDLRKALKR